MRTISKWFPTGTQEPARADSLAFKNRLLAFPDEIEARFEAETGAKRAAHLRRTIIIGLIFYNVYNLSGALLMPDILWLGVALHVLVVTPESLMLAWAVSRVSPRLREALMTGGMINAIATPIFLFWLTTYPLGAYTFTNIPVTLVFGMMMLVLRFSQALIFGSTALAMMILAIVTKHGLGPELETAFCIEAVTCTFFVLYGNYQIEATRRAAYLTSLSAILRSDSLELDKQQFAVLSATDPLTGLANRRLLDESLARWDATPRGDRDPIAVLMIDVDHFKLFNDTYGHPAGDACLRHIAKAIEGEIHTGKDLAVRYGGEEFIVFLRGADAEEPIPMAERIRCAVETLRLPNKGTPYGTVTVSIGAVRASAGETCVANALLAAADEALYDAKGSGRNTCRLRCLAAETTPGAIAA